MFNNLKYITECSNNKYGQNCSNTCDCNSQNTIDPSQLCDIKHGTCLCNTNWTGMTCDDDVNECENDAICHKYPNTGCHNTHGGYRCGCRRSFVQAENGTCIGNIVFDANGN